MTAKFYSCAIVGLEGVLVEVEVDLGHQMPGISIVGLPDKAVDEAKERVRSAMRNSGFHFPRGKVTINLAPADLRKEGPSYDLPIALGILNVGGDLVGAWGDTMVVGELSLDGSVRGVAGVLPTALFAKEKGFRTLIVPEENAAEASLVRGIMVIPVKRLSDTVLFLQKELEIEPLQPQMHEEGVRESDIDIAFIRGQEHVKRALEIAAAGGHNILLIGPPGTGKTFLARAFPSILPSLSEEESLEVTKIHSVAGTLPRGKPLIRTRVFRAPHHSASAVSLVGGGSVPRPGEISLAHRGVLFLDEFPEFSRSFLESLRQPLEDGFVTISRAQGSVTFPARFILIASQNPCPCGYSGDRERACICSPAQIHRYQRKISGPLLDRIDLCVTVPKVDTEKLTSEQHGESSALIRTRVHSARQRQQERFAQVPIFTNTEMNTRHVEVFCRLDAETKKLITSAMKSMHLSARAYSRTLKVARTIADLAASDTILSAHVAEALQYRESD